MSKNPAVLLYTSDFLVGTMFMSNEETGKYIKLLCVQHQKNGYIPAQDFENILSGRCENVRCKFEKKENMFFNKRMLEEIEKRKKYSDSRSSNRRKTKELSSKTYEKHMKTYEKHMENENENENINENKKEIEDKNTKKITKKIKHKYGSEKNVLLTTAEYLRLQSEYPDSYLNAIEFLSLYIAEKGYKSKSHNLALRRWVFDAVEKRQSQQKWKKESSRENIEMILSLEQPKERDNEFPIF